MKEFDLKLYICILSILLFSINIVFCSGGFDHGTSTGKDKLQIDLTWNPFNLFKNGQSYVVLGYGITDKLDLHAYYCDHGNYNNGVKSYYLGIFYQFLDSRLIDLATAFGRRKMMDLNHGHFFFPQLLFNIKIKNNYSIGGSIVNIKIDNENLIKESNTDWRAIDVALFIPLTRYFEKYKNVDEVKLGIGTFKTGLGKVQSETPYMPTYSIDIKLKRY